MVVVGFLLPIALFGREEFFRKLEVRGQQEDGPGLCALRHACFKLFLRRLGIDIPLAFDVPRCDKFYDLVGDWIIT